MGHVLADVRHSFRLLRKNPGFAAAAILVFGLGIGANTAVFSVVNSVLLRPLVYRSPENLVVLQHSGANPASPADFLDWRRQSKTLENMASAQLWSPALTTASGVEAIPAMVTSPNLFDLLGVKPILGRAYSWRDEKATEQPLVLSYSLWQRKFGGDAAVIGRKLVLDDEPYIVTAVMPPGFYFAPFWATRAEMWGIHKLGARVSDRAGRSLRIFARLKGGVPVSEAQAEMNVISAQLAAQYADTNANLPIQVIGLTERTVGSIRPMLLVLMGTVAFVLLIACANTGNLMLARATARKKEIAVRLALGAKRRQLLQAFLTESLLTALLGGIAGALLASWAVSVLTSFMPPGALPRQIEVSLDAGAFVYCLAISVLVGVLAGVLPAWQAAKGNLNDALKAGGRGNSDTAARHRTRSVLVAAEVALSVALLIGAGLFMRSFVAIQAIDPGFDASNVLTLTVASGGTPEGQPGRRLALYNRILEEVRHVPGVESAGIVNHVPIAGDEWGTQFLPEGREAPQAGQFPTATWRVAMPGYFKTMRIAQVEGRDFQETDNENAPAVVIVNETLARRYWPNQSAIGKRLTLENPAKGSPVWRTVAGVVHDLKQTSLTANVREEIYLPLAQSKDHLHSRQRFMGVMTVAVQTDSAAAELAPSIKAAIWNASHGLAISNVMALDKVMSQVLWRERVTLGLFAAFALLALILSGTGIYAVISNLVNERRQEIGIRMALGANTTTILKDTLGRAIPAVLGGSLAGLTVAFVLSRFLKALLYQVKPSDPGVFAISIVAMIVTAAAAVLLPALRASKLDPLIALRQD